jgi:hypothetical protein
MLVVHTDDQWLQGSRHGGRAGVQSEGYSMTGYLGPVTVRACNPKGMVIY